MTDHLTPLIIITGPSGAGLSTALDALEDCGFEAIDNLPLRMIQPMAELSGPKNPLGLGVSARAREFSAPALLEILFEQQFVPGQDLQLIYIDCETDTLLTRYSVTRRPHPVCQGARLADSIAREKELLLPLKSRADILINTTELTPHQLRAEILRWFSMTARPAPIVQLQSFSYKRGLPRSADLVFDCRFLQNPHWETSLRRMTGLEPPVQEFVSKDPRFEEFFTRVKEMCLFLLPAVQEEGKSYLTLAFGCSGGRHRSVTMAELMGQALAKSGWQVSIRHRELETSKQQEKYAS
jgi:UPF0042 nucleotide-binding protein